MQLGDGQLVTLRGTYVRDSKTKTETFYTASLTINGTALSTPAPTALTLADIERGAFTRAAWFQKVSVTIGAGDTLHMFDFTPPELAGPNTQCDHQLGFGMLPASASGTPGMACANNTTQPPGQSSVNAAEVLIADDFYKGFTISSDCRCAGGQHSMEPTMSSTAAGPISGILLYSAIFGGVAFQYLAPKTNTDFPITNTIPGM
jgi:hypothetical protein